MDKNTGYGIEHFGRLKKAMLHRPEQAIKLVTEENRGYYLFDGVPNVDRYLEEHQQYETLLRSQGVEVLLLADYVARNVDLIACLPNLAYLHDTAVVTSHGFILSRMSSMARCHEEIVVKEALLSAGIPLLYEPAAGDAFEGCLLVSPATVFVADTERHSRASIERFITGMLEHFDEVIYAQIPQERRFMHPDMVLNRMTEQLMVYYPPAFLQTYLVTKQRRTEVELKACLHARNIELVPLSDGEQQRWGSSFVPLQPGLILNYDISLEPGTISLLEREGVRFIHFHPDALLAGGGSLRCLTLRLWRE